MKNFKIIVSIIINVLFAIHTQAANLIKFEVINENTLMLLFNDGDIIQHNQPGQNNDDDDSSNLAPLNISAAENRSNYILVSSDDSDYDGNEIPTDLGRFTKGKEFSAKQADGFPISYDHQIFLVLPYALKQGKNYGLSINNILNATSTTNFQFDVYTHHSEAVHLNQIGYLPNAGLKFGYVGKFMGDLGSLELNTFTNTPFHLVDDLTNNIVFSGTLTERRDLQTGNSESPYGTEFYGADVWECDFSSFNTPGTYRLVVEKFGSSYPFEINENVFEDIFYDTSRSLFHQRCGVELDAAHTDFPRPLCHHPSLPEYSPVYTTVRNQDNPSFEDIVDNATSTSFPNAFKRYHDAADWDSRSRHLYINLYLNTLFEMKPNSFFDGQMNIPESGNGLPDILDESKFGMDFFRNLIGPTGGICGGIEENEHPVFGDASYLDNRPWFVLAEEPKATFSTAAVLAQYTHILKNINQLDSVDIFTQEAIDLYTWATNNTKTNDESAVFEERILAASLLYRLTGNTYYHNQFKSLYDNRENYGILLENAIKLHFAIYFYVKNDAQHPIDQSYVDDMMNEMRNWSDFTSLGAANNRAFRYANNPYRPQRFGASSVPYMYHLILMYELTNDNQYLDLANTTLDYFLGGNLTDMCWISGHGFNTIEQYMHLDSFVDGIEDCIPGYSVYGINYEPQRFGWITFDGHGYTNMYPSYQDVPAHSAYLENRYCPASAEFTVHETSAPWIFNLGYFLPESCSTQSCNTDPCKEGGVQKWNSDSCACEIIEATKTGCADTDATNYDPTVNCPDNSFCQYIDEKCNDKNIFETYAWLKNITDSDNCNFHKITVITNDFYSYIYVAYPDKGVFYNEDGSIWAEDFGDYHFVNWYVNIAGYYENACFSCGNIPNTIFDRFPWLLNYVDPENCNGENIEIYDYENTYTFIRISTNSTEGLYFGGYLYCDDAQISSCLAHFNLTNPIESWSCEDLPNNHKNGNFTIKQKLDFNKTDPLLKVYPNPSEGQVFIDLDVPDIHNFTINIYDAQGKVVFTEKAAHHLTGNRIELNLSELIKGIYMVEVQNWQFKQTQKLLIN